MNKTGQNRLLKLADYLDTLSPAELRMDAWFSKRRGYDVWDRQMYVVPDLYHGQNVSNIRKLTSECGYAACAVGHACSIPSFRKAGLKLTKFGNYTDPTYKGSSNWYAVESFFDIDNHTAKLLFSSDSYKNPRVRPSTVANRIRKFVTKGV